MTIEEFAIVINKIKDFTDTVYLHIKGEPLMHSNLDEILSICEDNKIKVRITTNGTLLKKKIDILKKHSLNQINVSLHCENDIKDYLENVFSVCNELKKKTTIVYRIWALPSMKIDKMSTKIVDKIKDYYQLDDNIVNKIMNDKNIKIEDNLYLDKDYEFIWPKITDDNNEYGTCLGTKTHIGILSNGVVVPCCLDSNGVINLGNIFNDDLDMIINSELFKNINNGFKNSKIYCNLCKSCTYRNRFIKKDILT